MIQGVLFGISLSFLIGPLLFAIVEAALVQGFRAGISVAFGIWTSDLLFMGIVTSSLSSLERLAALPAFRTSAGVAGGLILFAFGAGILLKKKSEKNPLHVRENRHKPYWLWSVRGFLLNTINPFTVFFWIGLSGAVLIPNNWNTRETLVFFTGMLGTLVLADTLKAYGAKRLRKFLTPDHIRRVQMLIGWLLVLFGLAMMVRVFLPEQG
ncbi:MAG: LysE family transporter [Saprospiraceae bacterium]|nr:LysE family transporter [Saprospiraceae bacterium]